MVTVDFGPLAIGGRDQTGYLTDILSLQVSLVLFSICSHNYRMLRINTLERIMEKSRKSFGCTGRSFFTDRKRQGDNLRWPKILETL